MMTESARNANSTATYSGRAIVHRPYGGRKK